MSKSRKEFKSKINTVCNVLVKDTTGNYRKAFSVEGDKETDHSIYFVVWSDDSRDTIMKYSYHAYLKNSLVQTHAGKNELRDVSKKFQVPLSNRNKAIFSIGGIKGLSRLAIVEKQEHDIVISIQTKYLGQCIYLFYTTPHSLEEYSRQHDEIVLHTYRIPALYVQNIHFAVLVNNNTLSEIQKSNI